jgi:DHA1 family tetracycline resistance protein-like MFS transporter
VLPILFITVFLDLVGFGIIIPFLAYYVESFGANATTVGLLMSCYSLAQFVFAPIWGRISDRVGRRPILLLGLAGSVAGFAMFGLAQTLFVLFIGRAVMGIFGATIPTAQAAVADVTSPENRARGMGLIGAAIGLGFILGPAIGGVLVDLAPKTEPFLHNPYAFPCLAAAGLALLNLVAAAFFLPESLPAALRNAHLKRTSRVEQLAHGFSQPRLRALITIFFLFMLGFTMMEATLTLFIEQRIGTQDHAQLVRRVGYLFGFIGVVMVAMQGFLVGKLTPIFGEARILLAGLVIAAVALAVLPAASSWGTVYGCSLGLAAGWGLSQPTVASLISRAAPADMQGGALGVSQSAASLARVIGPFVAGVIFQNVAAGSPFVTGAALAVASAALALRLQNRA